MKKMIGSLKNIVRRLGAWLLCATSKEKNVILVPGVGAFIKNGEMFEVH